MKREIAITVLLTAVSFSLGGAIGGAVWTAYDAPHLGFAILGGFGGASLGMILKSGKKAIIGALICAAGFDIGFLLSFFILLALWEPVPQIQGLFAGIIGGAVGGVSFGLSMPEKKKIWLFALAGAIGFGLAAQVTWNSLRGFEQQALGGAIALAVWGVVGGAALGAALSYIRQIRKTAD